MSDHVGDTRYWTDHGTTYAYVIYHVSGDPLEIRAVEVTLNRAYRWSRGSAGWRVWEREIDGAEGWSPRSITEIPGPSKWVEVPDV